MPDPIDNPYATVPISGYQGDKTPYEDLSWLQKANYGFSENMYNQPVNALAAPDFSRLGNIKDTYNVLKTGGKYVAEGIENIVPDNMKISSEAAFNAHDNRINQIAEQTGTATSHGSVGVGNGMYMENPGTFEDGDKVTTPEINWDKLYEGIARREHRGYWGTEGYNPYIRTKGTKGQRSGDEKGSTAYGPIQITGDRLTDLTTGGRRRHYWDDPTQDYPEQGGVSWDQKYVDQLLEQSRLFQKYGGADMPTGGIDPDTKEDISRYDYGQAGDLSGEEYHEKYKDLGIVLLKGTYNILKSKLDREPTIEELVKHWRGGNVDEEPEYVTDVVDFYNKNPKKEKIDFTKVMGSATYKEPVLPTGPPLIFPTRLDDYSKTDTTTIDKKKDGGYTYAKDDKTTSRYMKSFKKFNDGGKVGNVREDEFTGWVRDRQPYRPDGVSPRADIEMVFKNQYNTELNSDQLADFLLWATNWKNPYTGKGVNMNDEGTYDVRGFWKSGDWKNTDSRGHGSDRWKKPNHPTFSEESIYSKQKEGSEFDGGVWMDNGAFIPGFHNMHDNERLLWEFSHDEGPEHLIGSYVLPEVTVTPETYEDGTDVKKKGFNFNKKFDYSPEAIKARQAEGVDWNKVENTFSWFPYTGEFIDAKNTITDLAAGNYGGAALNAAGLFLPIIPGTVLKKGVKEVKDWVKKYMKSDKFQKGVPDGHVRALQSDGKIEIIPKEDAVRINRVEDANLNNSMITDYETGNWYGTQPEHFYLNKTKKAGTSGGGSNIISDDQARNVYTGYLHPDNKAFNLSTDVSKNMSQAPNELMIYPDIQKEVRGGTNLPWLKKTVVKDKSAATDHLLDFYKKSGGKVKGRYRAK